MAKYDKTLFEHIEANDKLGAGPLLATHDAGGFAAGNVPIYGSDGKLTNSGLAPGGGSAAVWWRTPFEEPDPDDFTLEHDTGADGSIDATQGGIYFYDDKNSGGLHLLTQAAPSPPYGIEVAFIPHVINNGSPNMGLGWRNSSSHLKATLRLRGSSWGFSSTKWSTSDVPTDYTSLTTGMPMPFGQLVFMQIIDDNTNRISRWSMDGKFWYDDAAGLDKSDGAYHSVARTDHVTPNQVILFIDSSSASFGCGMHLLHWRPFTP